MKTGGEKQDQEQPVKKPTSKLHLLLPWKGEWNLANFLTFGALVFSIYQNYQNNVDNNKELARIHRRDSVQSYLDSLKTDVLIQELRNQVAENKRSRFRDSSQLSLFSTQIGLLNKSLISQNRGLEIQNKSLLTQTRSLETDKLSKRAQLLVDISLKPNSYNNGYLSVSPTFNMVNVGNTVALGISYDFDIITIDWLNPKRQASIIKSPRIHGVSYLNVGKSSLLNPYVSNSLPTKNQDEYNRHLFLQDRWQEGYLNSSFYNEDQQQKIKSKAYIDYMSFRPKKWYPPEQHTHIIFLRITYFDKYGHEPIKQYILQNILPYFNEDQVAEIATGPLSADVLPYLKRLALENNYDFQKMQQAVY